MTERKCFVFKFADVEVREREFLLIKAGERVPLEPKAFRVLLYLLRNPGRLIPKDEVVASVWSDSAVSDNSLTRSIAQLRRVLGDDSREPIYILTVPTVGYRWVSKVEVSEEAPAEAQPPPESQPPLAPIDEQQKALSPKKLTAWLLPAGSVLLLCLAGAAWYLHRPLPPPRIAGYTQITFDGLAKRTGGTDGSRLYFSAFESGLRQISASGGVSEPISTELPNPTLRSGRLSPDGTSLLVRSFERGERPAQPVSIVRVPGGSVHYLTDAVSATWSADGKSIVYSTEDGEIDLIRSDGTRVQKLARVGGSVDGLSWSPNGSTIRFFKDLRPWEMSSNGSSPHELLHSWRPSYTSCCGLWTPDGEFFIYQAGNQGGPSQLWALDERRGLLHQPSAEPVQLTSGPIDWRSPVPSKDGKRIFAGGLTRRGELVRFNVKSGTLQPFLGGISAEFVDFSKDGKSVLYVSYPDGILWKANRDGGKPVQLTEPPIYPVLPHWSPDGSQILYGGPPHARSKAYIVSSDGGRPRLVLPEDNGPQDDPNWSPDGRKIVFSNKPEAGVNPPGAIRILDLASRQVRALPGSEGFWSPRWSPNGRFIEAASDDAVNIKVFDLATQRAWVLSIGGDAYFHAWSRDSRFIYFESEQSQTGVFRIPVNGGKPELVLDLKDFQPWGSVGYYMSLDPTDAPLLLRYTGTFDIYALTLEDR